MTEKENWSGNKKLSQKDSERFGQEDIHIHSSESEEGNSDSNQKQHEQGTEQLEAGINSNDEFQTKQKLKLWQRVLKKEKLSSINNVAGKFNKDNLKKVDWKGMFQNFGRSIGSKLFLIIFSSILFFVLLLGFFSYNTSKNVIEQKMTDSTLQTVTQTTSLIDLMFKQYVAITTQLFVDANLMDNIRSLQNEELSEQEVTNHINEIIKIFKNIDSSNSSISGLHYISLVNDRHVSTLGVFQDMETIKNEPWFQQTINESGSTVWTETRNSSFVVPNSNNKASRFALSRLMKDSRNGANMGIFVMEIKLSAIDNQLKSIKLGDTGSIFMLNDKNQYVQSFDYNLIGTKFDASNDFSKRSGNSIANIDGVDSLVVHHKSEDTDWNLVAVTPIQELVKEVDQIASITILLAILSIVVAVAIGILVMRMVSKPIVELRNLMKEGETGNLNVRSRFNRKDEIGQLGESFNQMMHKITELVRQTNDSALHVLNNAKELTDFSNKTSVSAREISMATEEIASGATTLAMEAERGNDMTMNMGGQLKQVIKANLQMASSSADVQKSSEQGIQSMSDLIDKTHSTEQMTSTMVEKVDKLKESTSSITQILEVLKDITKQTNILSLNAAIEASRAGAAGKGFMVVADEIRKLADQSRNSIQVVAQITDKIQSEIDETVMVLSQAYPLFQSQISSVKVADSIFKDVQVQMNHFVSQLDGVTESIHVLEQSQGSLSDAMSSVSAVSEQSSATSQQVASLCNEQLVVSENLVHLSEQLEEMSKTLQQSLKKFEF